MSMKVVEQVNKLMIKFNAMSLLMNETAESLQTLLRDLIPLLNEQAKKIEEYEKELKVKKEKLPKAEPKAKKE